MMNENYNTPNSNCCGRPMQYAPEQKCKYNNCCMNEYKYTMPACIRNKQPDCTAQAVIPSITVETADGITNLANCFVHVTSNNTTYYIDDKHRPMIIWSGNVNDSFPEEVVTPEQKTSYVLSNPLNLRNQFAYYKGFNSDINKTIIDSIYYDNTGKAFWAGEFEEMTEE